MTLLSLLAALLLEQARPLREGNAVHLAFERYARLLEGALNGGERRHGVIAWTLAVLPPVLAVAALHHALHGLGPVAAWLWSVVVLYFTMGFRRFSHVFTEIHKALAAGDLAAARDRLGNWRGESAHEYSAGETARVAIEQGLVASHRHVFGTIAWFVALGPAGAVIYRAAAMLGDGWGARSAAASDEFGEFAARAFHWLDWVPARLTAASFAVVGDFEDAVYCWRTQAAAWAAEAQGIVLAAAGGALGVRLGGALPRQGTLDYRPELGVGDEADTDHMQQAVGLVWRALVLWLFLVLVVGLVRALG